MKRICPFCKSELHKNDIHFCSKCGSLLPENLQLKDYSPKSVYEIRPKVGVGLSVKESVKKTLPRIFTFANLKIFLTLVVILTGLAVCFYYLTRSAFPKKVEEEQVKQTSEGVKTQPKKTDDKNTVYLETSIKNGLLVDKKASEFVPYDVDLYANFNGVDLIEQYFGFLGIGFSSFVQDTAKDLGTNYSFFAKNMEGVNSMVFIFFPTNSDLKIKDYAGWKIQKRENALIVSENQTLMTEVLSSKDGLIKSLGLNPNFVSIKSTIPVEGKAFLVTFNDTGKETLNLLLAKTSSKELKSIIEAYKKLNSNYLIVK